MSWFHTCLITPKYRYNLFSERLASDSYIVSDPGSICFSRLLSGRDQVYVFFFFTLLGQPGTVPNGSWESFIQNNNQFLTFFSYFVMECLSINTTNNTNVKYSWTFSVETLWISQHYLFSLHFLQQISIYEIQRKCHCRQDTDKLLASRVFIMRAAEW